MIQKTIDQLLCCCNSQKSLKKIIHCEVQKYLDKTKQRIGTDLAFAIITQQAPAYLTWMVRFFKDLKTGMFTGVILIEV